MNTCPLLITAAAILAASCSDGGSSSTAATDANTDTAGTSETTTTTEGTTVGTTAGTSEGTTEGTTAGTGSDSETTDTETDTTTDGEPGVVRVVYRKESAPDFVEIFAVDVVDGMVGAPMKVNLDPVGDESLSTLLRSSQDRSWLAYEMVSESMMGRNLHLADLHAPGTVTQVTVAPAPEYGTVIETRFSDAAELLIFSARADQDSGTDIFMVSLEGGQPGPTVRLNPATSPSDGVGGFTVSPDGTRIAYTGSIDDGIANAYLQNANTTDPGAPVLVSDNVDPAIAVGPAEWLDDDWILYRSDVDDDGIREVFVVDVSGAPGTPIFFDPGDTVTVRGPGMAPDMRGFAYFAGDGSYGDLYFAPFDGASFGAATLVNTIGPGGDVFSKEFAWSPDSSWLVYSAQHNTPMVREAFAVDMSGGAPATPIQVNGPLVPNGEINTMRISPEGAQLYYTAEQDSDSLELYRASLQPGQVGPDERVHAQTIDNSTEIIFEGEDWLMITGQIDGGVNQELFYVDLQAAPLTAEVVNAPHPDAGVKFGAEVSPSGRVIVYSAGIDPETIYLVDREGAGLGSSIEVAADVMFGITAVLEP